MLELQKEDRDIKITSRVEGARLMTSAASLSRHLKGIFESYQYPDQALVTCDVQCCRKSRVKLI